MLLFSFISFHNVVPLWRQLIINVPVTGLKVLIKVKGEHYEKD